MPRPAFAPGDTLGGFVNTNPASDFSLEIYRMGYYGGAGGRLVSKLGPFRGRLPDPRVQRITANLLQRMCRLRARVFSYHVARLTEI